MYVWIWLIPFRNSCAPSRSTSSASSDTGRCRKYSTNDSVRSASCRPTASASRHNDWMILFLVIPRLYPRGRSLICNTNTLPDNQFTRRLLDQSDQKGETFELLSLPRIRTAVECLLSRQVCVYLRWLYSSPKAPRASYYISFPSQLKWSCLSLIPFSQIKWRTHIR